MTSVLIAPPATTVPLNRRVALLRPDRIDVRPARAALLGPLTGFALGLGSGIAIWFGMAVLPLWLLALLLIIAVVTIPLSGLGTIYALLGAHVVIDRAKQSATWQQGFLGMGVGTTELVPFWKVEQIVVEEAGSAGANPGRPVEEFAQWRVVLVKKSGKRLEIGVATTARSLGAEAYERARVVAAAVAELTGAPLQLPPSRVEMKVAASERQVAAERARRAQTKRRRKQK